MTALFIIFGFVIVLGALNVFEFGRNDCSPHGPV